MNDIEKLKRAQSTLSWLQPTGNPGELRMGTWYSGVEKDLTDAINIAISSIETVIKLKEITDEVIPTEE